MTAIAVSITAAVGFVVQERRTEFPLLDFALFRSSRFSTGAAAISVAFFAMVGFIFGLPQYFQFVQGFTPFEAGIRFLPTAFGFMAGAIGSEMLAVRIGSRRLVVGGLVIVSAVMPLVLLWGVDTSYLVIGPVIAAIGLGVGMVVAPSSEAVMGAVDQAKAGVGSAMNDVTQMLASALSIAVIGSVMYAIYSARLGDAAASLPAEARDAVQDSVGAAVQAATTLPQSDALILSNAARASFTDALGLAILIGSGLTLIGAVVIARFMPASQASGHGSPHGGDSAHSVHAAPHGAAAGD